MTEAHLQYFDPDGRRRIVLDTDRLTIGRRSDNGLQIKRPGVSREHAEIVRQGENFLLRDCGSRYGTFVNGDPVTEHQLRQGDMIRFGREEETGAVFHLGAETVKSPSTLTAASEFRHLAALLEGLRALGTGRVLEDVLVMVLDSTLEVSGAERGFIMLASEDDELEYTVGRSRGRKSLSGTAFETSRRIPEQVFTTGTPRLVADMLEGDLLEDHRSTIARGIRTVLCLPLQTVRMTDEARSPEDTNPETVSMSLDELKADTEAGTSGGKRGAPHCIGVLYLDSRRRGPLLSHAMQSALETLAREAAVAIENARLYREAEEKARIEQELRVAAQIQQALLPPRQRIGEAHIAAGATIPSQDVGGDFFDYLDLPGEKTGFVVGDVSGKGPQAALLAALIQGMFSSQAESDTRPAETMRRVNRALVGRTSVSSFATVAYVVVAPDGHIVSCNGGHNPPLVVRRDGRIEPLVEGGLILGVSEAAQYAQSETVLQPGDSVVLYSDGLNEAFNAAEEEFGDERIYETLKATAGCDPEELLDRLLAAVRTFTGDHPQSDDMTALAVQYRTPVQKE